MTTPFIKTKAPFAFFCSYAARPALFILLANKRVLIIAINPPKTEEIASEEPTAKKTYSYRYNDYALVKYYS